MTASGPVLLEERGPALWATISRPGALNALDEAVLEGLEQAVGRAGREPGCRALCLTGAGDAFCVGLDTDCLERGFRERAYFRLLLHRVNRLFELIGACPVPVVAAVNGLTRAGGFELLLATDLAIAADEARVGDNHLPFGVVPGGGSTQRAPRRIGVQRAKELIFTGRWLDGAEAAELGLVLAHVPRRELVAAVDSLVATLARKPRGALAAAKLAVQEGAALPLDAGVAFEMSVFFEYLDTDPEAQEGFRRYLRRREERRAARTPGTPR